MMKAKFSISELSHIESRQDYLTVILILPLLIYTFLMIMVMQKYIEEEI